jgi:hypothetical protein
MIFLRPHEAKALASGRGNSMPNEMGDKMGKAHSDHHRYRRMFKIAQYFGCALLYSLQERQNEFGLDD